MNMDKPLLDTTYWESRWAKGETGWDIGDTSIPLKEYFDQVTNKQLDILIPGCGQAWEGEYLHKLGFRNVYLMDMAPTALEKFKARVPDFPDDHLLLGDFFELDRTFDIIVEQTFFCAINPGLRGKYASKSWSLLNPGGRLIGLLFDTDFGNPTPPYGGTRDEYLRIFQPFFRVKYFDTAYNSIKPRFGRELFIHLTKH